MDRPKGKRNTARFGSNEGEAGLEGGCADLSCVFVSCTGRHTGKRYRCMAETNSQRTWATISDI